MRQGSQLHYSGYDPSERLDDRHADEARLGLLLERTYAAHEARLMPTDAALARLDAALDAIGTPPQRYTDHRRLFGACALVAILLVLLGPVVRTEFTAGTRNAPRSVVTPISRAVGSGAALPPVAIAASEGRPATDRTTAANGTTSTTGASETPLRDLLARAGIRPSDPAGGASDAGEPPQH
ncbi:MAG: hypothetical protein ACR2JW_19450 [Thermomicrobiales bacterium]